MTYVIFETFQSDQHHSLFNCVNEQLQCRPRLTQKKQFYKSESPVASQHRTILSTKHSVGFLSRSSFKLGSFFICLTLLQ